MEWTEIIIGIAFFIIALYYWLTSTFDFWSSRGVAGPSPKPWFGNLFDVAVRKLSFFEYVKKQYDAHRDEKMFGIFLKRNPALVLIDPDLIKSVLMKDFSVFSMRGIRVMDFIEPLAEHMFNVDVTEWRSIRNKLSPVFTGAKVKKNFHLLLECGEHLEKCLAQLASKNDTIECRELTTKYATDVIGSCVFGLQTNALGDECDEFRMMGRYLFDFNWIYVVKERIRHFAPWLHCLLRPFIIDRKVTEFFLKIMRDTVEYRKKNQIVKHDVMDVIMELKNKADKDGELESTDIKLASQFFVTFAAGFDTSAVTMSNALYELAQHQTMQDKLRDDINQGLAKNNGEITYEGIQSMTYLNMVFQETLRKYPPGALHVRASTQQYTFAGTKVTIPKGTILIIPTFAIHRDPRIYPKPDEFDPERFTDEAIEARHSMNWLPFGEGPKKCVAGHFSYFQSKVGLIKILRKYKVEVCDKTQIPYLIDPEHFVLTPSHGIHVKISKIKLN